MVNGVWSAFEMARYQQQPAAHERKSLRACSETRGCFNHDMINNPALKIGFTNNYRRWMGEVKFLNQNHFNYRVQRTRKDLCWWVQCQVKATIKARDRWVRPTQHKRAKRAPSDMENSISITLIHQRPLTAEFGWCLIASVPTPHSRFQTEVGLLAPVWSSVWSSELHAVKWRKGCWVKGEITRKGPKWMQVTVEMINQMTDYIVLVGASAHLQTS